VKANQDFLSNIVEEGSLEDLPKTFEEEERYLNDCLRSVGGSTEDVSKTVMDGPLDSCEERVVKSPSLFSLYLLCIPFHSAL
jgi:hypothetical protein